MLTVLQDTGKQAYIDGLSDTFALLEVRDVNCTNSKIMMKII